MTNEQIIMVIVGAAMASVVAILTYFVKSWFDESKSDREALAKKLLRLSNSFNDLEKRNITHLAQFDKNMTENHMQLAYKIDLMLKDQGKLEGRLDDHIGMISQYISSMRNMSDKLEAVFRFIDAQPRVTDIGGK